MSDVSFRSCKPSPQYASISAFQHENGDVIDDDDKDNDDEEVAQLVKLITGSSVASWRKALTVLIVIIAYTTGLGDRLSLHI